MFKIPCKNQSKNLNNQRQKGVTLLELVAVVAILGVITTVIIVFVDPITQMKKSRDEKRLSDISKIDIAVSEFMLNERRFPDQENILRKSIVLPAGSGGLNNAHYGWIYEDLTLYMPMLPIDPLNNEEYYYSYKKISSSYEINAVLEIMLDKMIDDGGNDPNVFEIGNNLNLISP